MAVDTEKPATKAVLKACARGSSPSRFLDYKDFLRALQAGVEQQCGRYSFIQYSKDLGFDRSNVAYMVIHGWRRLSDEQAETICHTLGISGAERRFLLKLVAYTDARSEPERQTAFQGLVALKEQLLPEQSDRNMLRFFSEWHHAAIFELVATDGFRSDPQWIAGKFFKPLSDEDVLGSLDLLTNLGLIRYDQTAARHVKVSATLSTGDEVRGLAVVGYHFRMLELAAGALTQVPAEDREMGSLTLAIDEKLMRRLQDDMRQLKRYIVFAADHCAQPDRVVQLNMQLFALTRA